MLELTNLAIWTFGKNRDTPDTIFDSLLKDPIITVQLFHRPVNPLVSEWSKTRDISVGVFSRVVKVRSVKDRDLFAACKIV
uniref:RNA methyltransferase n=1 Tax=Globodera pallida TaxID=36090 RepID=A0A183C179_GLOPA